MRKAKEIKSDFKASTWHELENNGKFDKNNKLTFISEDMLNLGCNIGSETHYARAIDTRGRELIKSAFSPSNTEKGFERVSDWALKLAAENGKHQIVMEWNQQDITVSALPPR